MKRTIFDRAEWVGEVTHIFEAQRIFPIGDKRPRELAETCYETQVLGNPQTIIFEKASDLWANERIATASALWLVRPKTTRGDNIKFVEKQEGEPDQIRTFKISRFLCNPAMASFIETNPYQITRLNSKGNPQLTTEILTDSVESVARMLITECPTNLELTRTVLNFDAEDVSDANVILAWQIAETVAQKAQAYAQNPQLSPQDRERWEWLKKPRIFRLFFKGTFTDAALSALLFYKADKIIH